jgi:hypothetical protein
MNRSYSKIRHIQEANKALEKRVISDNEMSRFIKKALKESLLPNIQEGDELCDILCYKKQAKFGSNGEVVKLIQNALVKCGFNAEHQGGGMIQGCKDDYTKCDGKFREETKKATEEFQKDNNLVVDGSVGFETLKKLEEKGCIKLPDCKCNELKIDKTEKENKEWWKLIGKDDPKFGDCNKINACIYKTLKNNPVFSWDKFLDCMDENVIKDKPKTADCSKCPKIIDKMPKRGDKTNPENDLLLWCVANKCSEVVY